MASSGRRRRLTTIVVDERNAWSRSIDQDRSNGKMTFLKTSKDILINGTSSWHHIVEHAKRMASAGRRHGARWMMMEAASRS